MIKDKPELRIAICPTCGKDTHPDHQSPDTYTRYCHNLKCKAYMIPQDKREIWATLEQRARDNKREINIGETAINTTNIVDNNDNKIVIITDCNDDKNETMTNAEHREQARQELDPESKVGRKVQQQGKRRYITDMIRKRLDDDEFCREYVDSLFAAAIEGKSVAAYQEINSRAEGKVKDELEISTTRLRDVAPEQETIDIVNSFRLPDKV